MRFRSVSPGQLIPAPSARLHNVLVEMANDYLANRSRGPARSQSTDKDRNRIRVKLTEDTKRGDPVAYGAAIRSSIDDFDQYTSFGPTFPQVPLTHEIGHKFGFAHRGGKADEVIPVVVEGVAIANLQVRNVEDGWAYPFLPEGEESVGKIYTGTGGFCQLLDVPASTGAQTVAVLMGSHQPLWRFESVDNVTARLWHFNDDKEDNTFDTPEDTWLNPDTVFDDLDAGFRGLLYWVHPYFVPIQGTCAAVEA